MHTGRHTGGSGIRQRVAGAALTCSLGVFLGSTEPALAVGTYKLGASAGVDYNSNVFDIASGAPLQTGVKSRGDTIQIYNVTGDALFDEGPISFDLGAKGTHYEYQNNGVLSHNEESASGKLRWQPGTVLDAQLDYTYNRAMAPFAQTLTQVLSINTDKIASALIGLNITPVWRLELAPTDHRALTPLLGLQVGPDPNVTVSFPDFQLHERGGIVTLNYLGQSHLTAGINVSYDDGKFTQIAGATKFRQVGTALVAKYKIDELSSFTGNLGYTSRNTVPNPEGNAPGQGPAAGQVSQSFVGDVGRTGGATGMLSYSRTLSPKTAADINVFRTVNNYTAGANSVLTTGVGADVHWKPDSKFELSLGLQFQEDKFTGTVVVENVPGRVDHAYGTQFAVTYTALTWLGITGHTSYTDRDSNFNLAGYSAFEIGVDVKAALP